MIKVLDIGYDRKTFEQGSAVEARMIEYGKLFEELHLIIFAKKSLGFKEKRIAPNVWVYPTNSISRWFYVFDAARLGKRIVFDKKFVRGESVITAQDPFETGLVGLKIKRKWRIPLHIQLHTDPFSPFFNGFINFLRKRIAHKVLKNTNAVRTVSDSLAKRVENEFSISKNKIKTLPIYVDRARIENAKVSFDLHARFGWHFILLAVSRLSEEKNLSMALEVLKKLLTFFPNTGLVIVGSGPEENKLKSLSKNLGLDSNVAFVGWQEDIGSYYKTANLFIQTSNFEGYGLSLVEAGISGLPIVTTDVGIAKDLDNGKDAYICPVGDSEYMFKAVYDLVENNSKRENLKLNIMKTLESKLLSKENYMQEYKDMLENASKLG